jgi:predicted N-acyltransferase
MLADLICHQRNMPETSTISFGIQIAHTVQEIGQEAWDRLSQGWALASYRWYCFGETVLTDEMPLYITLSREGEAIARATFWLKRREWLPVSSKILNRLAQAVLHRWPLLVCQSPLLLTSGLILPDPPWRDPALKTITEVAQHLARQYRASFLIFDHLAHHEMQGSAWPDGFLPVGGMDPGTRLVITWPDFESYLKSLSKKSRRQYHLNCNHAADLGVEIKRRRLVAPLDEATLDRAVELIHNVEEHHDSVPDLHARAVLRHAHMVDATWLTAEIEGRMAGCCILLGDGDTRAMQLMGLDYEVRYAYFQLFYTMIQSAIEEGARVLRGGTSAYETKRRMGFELEDNNKMVVFPRNRGLHWIVRHWAID